jgi:hypothetical protein
LDKSRIGGVARYPVLYGFDCSFAADLGRDEIRFAHSERNTVGHRRRDVEVFSDAGGLHFVSDFTEIFFVIHNKYSPVKGQKRARFAAAKNTPLIAEIIIKARGKKVNGFEQD